MDRRAGNCKIEFRTIVREETTCRQEKEFNTIYIKSWKWYFEKIGQYLKAENLEQVVIFSETD